MTHQVQDPLDNSIDTSKDTFHTSVTTFNRNMDP
jgi:hypothetical protein